MDFDIEPTNKHQQSLFEIPAPDLLALRQAQYRELDRLLNAWQRTTGREVDNPPHLDINAVIRQARLALYDNSATPYEIVLFIVAALFRGPDDGRLERIEAGNA